MLEVSGSLLYLLSKIAFLKREIAGVRGDGSNEEKWRLWAWVLSLIGLPPVSWLLMQTDNWIFGWLELGAAPPVIYGLVQAYWRRKPDPPAWAIAKAPNWVHAIVIPFVIVGVYISVQKFGDLNKPSQWLEMVAVACYIVGTYLLVVSDDRRGYLCYEFMFVAAGIILFGQGNYLFFVQQIASFFIIGIAYHLAGKRQH